MIGIRWSAFALVGTLVAALMGVISSPLVQTEQEDRVAALETTVAGHSREIERLEDQVEDLANEDGEAPADEDGDGDGLTDEGGEDVAGESSRCEAVSDDLLAAIGSGLDGGGLTLREGQAVRSEEREEVWFVAADIEGPGLEGTSDIAVWATNSLEVGGGLILSVDALAQEFSVWPDADTTDAEIADTEDGVDEARQCVADALG